MDADPKPSSSLSAPVDALDLYRGMALIRECETRLGELFRDSKIPGFIHLSIGQEAIAAGVGSLLGPRDTVASTHRGHGHAIAKGMSPEALIHEILGNVEGACGGRGGSLHVADFSVGMLGANGIVGAGIPIAMGSAIAHKLAGGGKVAAVFFGDGALAEGVLAETLNMSSLLKLPVLFVCENNGWSEFSPTSSQYVGSFEALAAAFSVPFARADGNDVQAVRDAASPLLEAMRAGGGPAALECVTLRVKGHYEGDPQAYRKGRAEADPTDPLDVVRARLAQNPETAGQIAVIDEAVRSRVQAAIEASAAGTPPQFADALRDIYA